MKKLTLSLLAMSLTSLSSQASMICKLTDQNQKVIDESTYEISQSPRDQWFAEKSLDGVASYVIVLNPRFNRGRFELKDLRSGLSTSSGFMTSNIQSGMLNTTLTSDKSSLSLSCDY